MIVLIAFLIASVFPVAVVAQGAGGGRVSETSRFAGDPVRGLALLEHFGDSLPANRGNGLRCVSCHLENGLRASAMPWSGSAARYPRYRARPGREESLAERVNECIARSLAGRMITQAGRDMRDMMAYIEGLRSRERPAGVDTVRLVGRPLVGRRVYDQSCARCHGVRGAGLAAGPALWGAESFSVGAGMARQFTLATFVRHNMPFDGAGSLSPQAAADVAAYILRQPRQDHPGKERDWPKGDPPPDVAYATSAAKKGGKAMPPLRPLLPRRVSADSGR